MDLPDLGPLWLTIRLAAVTTVILLIIGTPLAWWLAFTRSRLKAPVEAVTALPLGADWTSAPPRACASCS